jgi:ComF family protein
LDSWKVPEDRQKKMQCYDLFSLIALSTVIPIHLYRQIFRRVTDLIYPSLCLLCGVQGEKGIDLCERCRHSLPWISRACARCALPLAVAAELCGHCLKHPPAYDAAYAPFRYESPINRLITGFKFHDRLAHARLFGALYPDSLIGCMGRLDCLVPIPLHPARMRQRGFNQAQLLAEALGCRFGRRVDPRALARRRNTPAQLGLSAVQRRANLSRAFSANRSFDGKRVGLIDDVITTGSTAQAAAATLKAAGALEVVLIAVARAG